MPACEWVAQSIELHHKPNLDVKHPIPQDKTASDSTDGPRWGKQEMFFAQRPPIKCRLTLTTISWGLHRVLAGNDTLGGKKKIWSFLKIVGDNYKKSCLQSWLVCFLSMLLCCRGNGASSPDPPHISSSCSIPGKAENMFSLIFNHTFFFYQWLDSFTHSEDLSGDRIYF